MDNHVAITAQIDLATSATIDRLAELRGISSAQFAAEAIQRVAESEADFAAFLKKGADSIARGDYLSHEDFVVKLQEWKRTRVRSR